MASQSNRRRSAFLVNRRCQSSSNIVLLQRSFQRYQIYGPLHSTRYLSLHASTIKIATVLITKSNCILEPSSEFMSHLRSTIRKIGFYLALRKKTLLHLLNGKSEMTSVKKKSSILLGRIDYLHFFGIIP